MCLWSFFILRTVCLHCFLSKLKYLCILRIQRLVWILPTFWTWGNWCFESIFQTGPHIFNRVHTILPDWWEMVWKLCSSLPLFIAQSTHFFISTESRRACEDCSYTWFIRSIVHYLWCVPGDRSFSFVHWKDVKNACYKIRLRRQCKPLKEMSQNGSTFPVLHCTL